MARTMTDRQRKALKYIADNARGETTAFDLKISGYGNLATIKQLRDRGYIRPIDFGYIAFPSSCTWRITDAGRKAANE